MFHAQGGWCFERNPDGSVRIVKFKDACCEEIESEVKLDMYSWCSVIASMSAAGETSGKWEDAKRFHGAVILLGIQSSFGEGELCIPFTTDQKVSEIIEAMKERFELSGSGHYELHLQKADRSLDPDKRIFEEGLEPRDVLLFFDLGNNV